MVLNVLAPCKNNKFVRSMLLINPKYFSPYALFNQSIIEDLQFFKKKFIFISLTRINSLLYISKSAGLKPLLTTQCIQINLKTYFYI